MLKLSMMFYVILFTSEKTTNGLTLSPCGEDQVFEVLENTPHNTCFCKADGSSGVVEWSLITGLRENYLGTCNLTKLTCTPTEIPAFTLHAESGYVSKVNINTTDMTNYFLQNASISCKLSAKLEEKCKIDSVVTVEDAMCHLRYYTGITPRRVIVMCTVGRAYSSLNRYTCQLYQLDKEAIKIGRIATMNISNSGKHYVSGFCEMSAPVSNTSGHFAYSAIISPGRKNITAIFTVENNTTRNSHIIIKSNPDILQSYLPVGAYVGGAVCAGIFLLAISVGVIFSSNTEGKVESTKKISPEGLVYTEIQFTPPSKQIERKKDTNKIVYTEVQFTPNKMVKTKKNTEEIIYTDIQFTTN